MFTSTESYHGGNSAGKPSGEAVQDDTSPLSIAIVGGGIVGVVLALGLLHRGVHVAIYERASDFHEIGAGFAFTAEARECMARLSPAISESMRRVGVPNTRPFDEYWDGYHHVHGHNAGDTEGTPSKLLFSRQNHQLAFWGCLRAQFLDELSSALPPGVVHFNKEFVSYLDPSSSSTPPEPVTLRFSDGSTAIADALIGCDGLRSRVRAQLLSAIAPRAINPRYTHKRCYRALVPLPEGERALGTYKANNQCMHVGPGAHVLTYPVGQKSLNIVMFVTDDKEWPDTGRMTIRGKREDVLARLESWGPAVRGLAALLPEEPVVWGIFDMLDNPAPWYAHDRVCLLGDAAHASAPHHGAGAGFGVEDALALATGLEEITKTLSTLGAKGRKMEAVKAALQAFSRVRYERTQWLVRSSRETGDIYEWAYPGSGSDSSKCKRELDERFRVIWDFDVNGMVEETRILYHLVGGAGGSKPVSRVMTK